MDVTAIAAGHAITSVLVKVVHLTTKRIGEPSRRFLLLNEPQNYSEDSCYFSENFTVIVPVK